MPISLHIDAVDATELKDMIHGLAGLVGGDVGEADGSDKPAPKRQTRAKKSETKPNPKPDPEKSEGEKAEANAEPAEKDADEGQKLEPKSVDDVKAAMSEMIDKIGDDGPKKAFEMLKEFGVDKASKLSAEQCAEYCAKAEALLAKYL